MSYGFDVPPPEMEKRTTMVHPLASPRGEYRHWPTSNERRSSPRYPAPLRVRCVALKGEDKITWTAQVRDLSTLGIGLLLPERPELTALLEIELVNRNGVLVRPLLARVVYIEEESGGVWHVGCAYVTELNDEELRDFQARAVRTDEGDCRRWTRFPCNVETVCYTAETAPGESRSGRVLNVSAGGVGLLLRCDFPVGTLLFFEMPGEAQRPILVRIVRVIEHAAGNWFLGCEFADQLSAEELQALVR